MGFQSKQKKTQGGILGTSNGTVYINDMLVTFLIYLKIVFLCIVDAVLFCSAHMEILFNWIGNYLDILVEW